MCIILACCVRYEGTVHNQPGPLLQLNSSYIWKIRRVRHTFKMVLRPPNPPTVLPYVKRAYSAAVEGVNSRLLASSSRVRLLSLRARRLARRFLQTAGMVSIRRATIHDLLKVRTPTCTASRRTISSSTTTTTPSPGRSCSTPPGPQAARRARSGQDGRSHKEEPHGHITARGRSHASQKGHRVDARDGACHAGVLEAKFCSLHAKVQCLSIPLLLQHPGVQNPRPGEGLLRGRRGCVRHANDV